MLICPLSPFTGRTRTYRCTTRVVIGLENLSEFAVYISKNLNITQRKEGLSIKCAFNS